MKTELKIVFCPRLTTFSIVSSFTESGEETKGHTIPFMTKIMCTKFRNYYSTSISGEKEGKLVNYKFVFFGSIHGNKSNLGEGKSLI